MKIRQVCPFVGPSTGLYRPSYLDAGAGRTAEQQGELAHPAVNRQQQMSRRNQVLGQGQHMESTAPEYMSSKCFHSDKRQD